MELLFQSLSYDIVELLSRMMDCMLRLIVVVEMYGCCCDAAGFCIIVVGIRVDLMESHGTNFESTSISGLRD